MEATTPFAFAISVAAAVGMGAVLFAPVVGICFLPIVMMVAASVVAVGGVAFARGQSSGLIVTAFILSSITLIVSVGMIADMRKDFKNVMKVVRD